MISRRCPVLPPLRRWRTVFASLAVVGLILSAALAAGGPSTERVSVSGTGAQANFSSDGPAMSRDGRFVAFVSRASNLVVGDTNLRQDVFVHDRQTGVTERVSVSSNGAQGNSASSAPAISDDGRFVAFQSQASNLVPGDTNASQDIFVRDRQLGTTTRVSVSSAGAQGSGKSANPSLSSDGHLVAFESAAPNLVAMDLNGFPDIFVRDLMAGTTALVSVDNTGAQTNGDSGNPVLSGNGRFVAYDSDANNLVAGDVNAKRDIFVFDRKTATVELVSAGGAPLPTLGDRNLPAINRNGRYVSFGAIATSLPGQPRAILLRDRKTGKTQLVLAGSLGFVSGISGDGHYVGFSTLRSLVAADTNLVSDVYLWNRVTSAVARVSVSSSGAQGNNSSGEALRGPALSEGGDWVAFTSLAGNLVAGDSNGVTDVFVRDRDTAAPRLSAPGSRKYGNVAVGAMKTLTVKIRNVGTATLTGTVKAVKKPFKITKGGGAFSIAPGKTKRVKVKFSPTAVGPAKRVLVITSNDPSKPKKKVKLIGAGV